MITSGSVGNDIIFDAPIDPVTKKVLNESSLCDQGQKFCNKMWNAMRLIQGWKESDSLDPSLRAINEEAAAWFANKLKQIISETEEKFDNYRLSDILMSFYNFIWGDFCSWYLEMIKPAYGQPIDPETKKEALHFFEQLMTLLHPFMPFVTEEIWHKLKDRKDGDDCIVSSYPSASNFDSAQIKKIEQIKDLITAVRDARSSNAKSPKDALNFSAIKSENTSSLFSNESVKNLLMKMANLSSLTLVDEEPADMLSFISGADRYFVDIVKEINVAEEKERITAELERNEKLLNSATKKLTNERFVAGAPPQVVANEKKKQADAQQRIEILKAELDKLT
jgi:valyl-tRNA synthetase